MGQMLHVLEGQILTDIRLEPLHGTARFSFDLGDELLTAPYDDELLEQWMLCGPSGEILTYRSDGGLSLYSPNTPEVETEFLVP